jgi:hypothetical protein
MDGVGFGQPPFCNFISLARKPFGNPGEPTEILRVRFIEHLFTPW